MAAPAAAVQRLFEACREVFDGANPGAVPPPARIERVKSALGN
jgi:cysteamine dioxygenase